MSVSILNLLSRNACVGGHVSFRNLRSVVHSPSHTVLISIGVSTFFIIYKSFIHFNMTLLIEWLYNFIIFKYFNINIKFSNIKISHSNI